MCVCVVGQDMRGQKINRELKLLNKITNGHQLIIVINIIGW